MLIVKYIINQISEEVNRKVGLSANKFHQIGVVPK
jgi:hypothetical protein